MPPTRSDALGQRRRTRRRAPALPPSPFPPCCRRRLVTARQVGQFKFDPEESTPWQTLDATQASPGLRAWARRGRLRATAASAALHACSAS